MRIAFFTDTFLPEINGVTRTLARLLDYLANKDIETLVLAPNHEKKDYTEYNVERFYSMPFFLYPERRFTFPNVFKMRERLQKFKPTLIHIITEFNVGLIGMHYAKRNNIPIVSSYHTDFYKYTKYYNIEFLENFCWSYMRWFHNQGRVTFCPSNETRKLLLSKGILNVKIWSRGVDCKIFTPEKRSNALRKSLGADDKILIHYAGRVAVEKDIDILMESIKNVNEIYKDRIRVIVTGNGPILKEIKASAPENVLFIGYKSGEELAEMYASADIFVFPSTTETFGNVVLESMASGVPVIGSASGGVKDIIQNAYNGILCKPRDVEDTTKAIIKMIEDKGFRKKLAENARKYALACSWEDVFDQLLGDYKEVIQKIKSQIFNQTG